MTGVPFKRLLGYWPNARLAVEIAFGADLTANPNTWTWTDVTGDVMFPGGPVTISPMGRGDETSKTQPAGCKFKLLNNSGDYGTGPASRWFPNVRRNTPVRVRVTLDGVTWNTRFQGGANGFTPSWDTSANLAVTSVSASGVLRRLDRRKTPLKSALWRATVAAGPFAHWPLEEERDAVEGQSSLSSGQPFTVLSGSVKFGQHTDIAGAVRAPELIAGKLSAQVPATTAGTGWAVHLAFKGHASAAGAQIIAPLWRTANGDGWGILLTDTGFDIGELLGNAGGADPPHLGGVTNLLGDTWHSVLLLVTKTTSTTTTVQVWLDGVDQGTNVGNPYTFSEIAAGPVVFPDESLFTIVNVDSFSMSHLAFFETITAPTGLASATTGYVGETATARLTRLCGEESVAITITGTTGDHDPGMGAQLADTFTNLLRECETADDGVLFDGRGDGLRYNTRLSRYNPATALTVDVSVNELDEPFNPIDDDQRNRNVAAVSRKGGSTATFADTAGRLGTDAIGVYDISLTVNTTSDKDLKYRAGWEVNKGTIDGLRYADLNLDLMAVPTLAPSWLGMEVGSRIHVTHVADVATQHPPGDIDLILEGWSEQLSPTNWTVTCDCSPYEAWHVGVIEGAGESAWRIDSGSSTLAANAAIGATSLSVASANTVELWSTSGGDYPRNIDVGGVEVAVTAVAGASSPQTFTVQPLPFALTAGWAVKLWRPATIAL